MVRKVSFVAALLFLVSFVAPTRANAQDKIELYGGYSYFNLRNAPYGSNLNGFILSGEYNFAPFLGGVAEFGGDYGGGQSLETYMFGPQVSFPARISPFAQFLVGGAHYDAPGYGQTSFATSLGFGINAKILPAISWRIVEGDWLTTRFGGTTQNNARISTGIVFQF